MATISSFCTPIWPPWRHIKTIYRLGSMHASFIPDIRLLLISTESNMIKLPRGDNWEILHAKTTIHSAVNCDSTDLNRHSKVQPIAAHMYFQHNWVISHPHWLKALVYQRREHGNDVMMPNLFSSLARYCPRYFAGPETNVKFRCYCKKKRHQFCFAYTLINQKCCTETTPTRRTVSVEFWTF